MAFSPQELELIKYGKANGKSQADVETAISRLRTGYVPPEPVKKEIKPTFGEQVVETAKAGVERIGQGFEQATKPGATPLDALESGIKAGEGVIQTATSPLAPLFSPIGKLIGYVSDKIAGNKAVQDFANSPAGEITSRVAEDVAGLSTIAGAVAGGKTAPKIASTVGRIASETADSLVGIADTGTTGIQKALSSTLDPSAIMQRVARISKGKQAAFEKQAGQSVGSYLVDNGIFGNIDEITTQLFDKFQKSRQVADDSLAKLKGNFKAKPVETALQTLFERETRVSSPGALSKDFARVRQLQQKYKTEGLNMSEINEVKRIYEKNIKVDYLKSQNPEGVAKATSLDTALREWQFAQAEKLGLKNLDDINKNTRLSKQLLDDLGKEYAGSAGNNAVGLTDWIILSGLDPTAISAFLAKKTFSSKGIQSAIAKKLAGEPTPPDTFPIFDGTPSIDNYGDWIKAIENQTKK